jgi:hypothetical protein
MFTSAQALNLLMKLRIRLLFIVTVIKVNLILMTYLLALEEMPWLVEYFLVLKCVFFFLIPYFIIYYYLLYYIIYLFRVHRQMKTSISMCLLLHQRQQDHKMIQYHPPLKGIGHVQSLEQKRRLKVALQILRPFLRCIKIKQNVASFVCKWLKFY